MGISTQYNPFGTLGEEVVSDSMENDLDAKIIITSHNSRPGLGKTTLAIRMARAFDQHGWTAESQAVMSAARYHEKYKEVEPGSVLLFDEVEGAADRRRSNSNRNVELSQAWAQNRYRNVVTICTLPTVSMLDKRLLELSDYWINCMRRGVAHPYRILVNDFNGRIIRNRMDEEAVIYYDDLPDGDDDYSYLSRRKDERRDRKDTYYTQDEVDDKLRKARDSARMDTRNDWFECLALHTDLSVKEISDLPIVDISRPRIHQILKD